MFIKWIGPREVIICSTAPSPNTLQILHNIFGVCCPFLLEVKANTGKKQSVKFNFNSEFKESFQFQGQNFRGLFCTVLVKPVPTSGPINSC